MDAQEAQKIVSTIQDMVSSIAPDAKERSMYGGLVYELDYLKPKRLFCGVFVRKGYVTIEFDRGTELKDKEGLLEGTGMNRRHLTVHDFSEIKSKKVKEYIKQSYQQSA